MKETAKAINKLLYSAGSLEAVLYSQRGKREDLGEAIVILSGVAHAMAREVFNSFSKAVDSGASLKADPRLLRAMESRIAKAISLLDQNEPAIAEIISQIKEAENSLREYFRNKTRIMKAALENKDEAAKYIYTFAGLVEVY